MEAPPPPPPQEAPPPPAPEPPTGRQSDDSDVEMDGVEYDPNEEQADDDEEFVPETTGMATRGEATKAPVAPVIRRVPSHVEPEIAEARRTQKERLAKLKEFGSVDGGSGDQREKRLNYLMAQSEVFSHFMEENSDLNLGKKKSKTGRTRMTEAAEDARLMKDAQSQLQVHRVTQQPSTITATMRPYQIEGLNWLVKLHDNGINGILADEMVCSRRPFRLALRRRRGIVFVSLYAVDAASRRWRDGDLALHHLTPSTRRAPARTHRENAAHPATPSTCCSPAGPRQDPPVNKLTRLPRGDQEHPRPPHLHRAEKCRKQLDARDAQVVPYHETCEVVR
jgi:hypothetical protein